MPTMAPFLVYYRNVHFMRHRTARVIVLLSCKYRVRHKSQLLAMQWTPLTLECQSEHSKTTPFLGQTKRFFLGVSRSSSSPLSHTLYIGMYSAKADVAFHGRQLADLRTWTQTPWLLSPQRSLTQSRSYEKTWRTASSSCIKKGQGYWKPQ